MDNKTINDQLLLAVACRKAENTKTALKNGADINYANKRTQLTALMIAVQIQNSGISQLLVRKKANLNLQNLEGNTALMMAAKINCIEILEILINNGADLNKQNLDGDTALIIASYKGYYQVVLSLMRAGANVNTLNIKNNSACLVAVYHKEYQIATELINLGANLDSINDEGMNVLLQAIVNQEYYFVKKLLEKNVDVNNINKEGTTALQLAFIHKKYDLCRELLKLGANPHFEYYESHIPLFFLMNLDTIDLFEEMIEKGAKIDIEYPGLGDIPERRNLLAASFLVPDTLFLQILLEHGAKKELSVSDNRPIMEDTLLSQNTEGAKIISSHCNLKKYISSDLFNHFVKQNRFPFAIMQDGTVVCSNKELKEALKKFGTKDDPKNKNSQSPKFIDLDITTFETIYKKATKKPFPIKTESPNDFVSKISDDQDKRNTIDKIHREENALNQQNLGYETKAINLDNLKIIDDVGDKTTKEKIDTKNYPTKGDGNCLIHALSGTLGKNNMFENTDHEEVREGLINYIRGNLECLLNVEDSSKIPIPLSILNQYILLNIDHGAVIGKYLNQLDKFEIQLGLILSIIEKEGSNLKKTVYSEEMETCLSNVMDLENQNEDLRLNYILKNSACRAILEKQISSFDSPLAINLKELTKQEENVQKLQKNAIVQSLLYYAQNGTWLTQDFAHIYAKKNTTIVIIYTGEISNEGSEIFLKYSYGKMEDQPILIGIRGGERGNHFEKIVNLNSWLENKKKFRTRLINNYLLVEKMSSEIITSFFKKFEQFTEPVKKIFLLEFIYHQGNSNCLNAYIQSLESNQNYTLPSYLWEGIAAEIYTHLKPIENIKLFRNKNVQAAIDFLGVTNASTEEHDYFVGMMEIYNYAAQFACISNIKDLIDWVSKGKINSVFEFLTRATVLQFQKEFTEIPLKKLNTLLKTSFPNADKTTMSEKRKQWLLDDSAFKIMDEKGNPFTFILDKNKFLRWKENVFLHFLIYTPLHLLSELQGYFPKIEKKRLENRKTPFFPSSIFNDEREFTLLLCYTLSSNETKKKLSTFLKDNVENLDIFSSMSNQLAAQLSSEESINNFIHLFYLHQIKFSTKTKQVGKNDSIFYKINKSSEQTWQEYKTAYTDTLIPSRKNTNKIQVVFTPLVLSSLENDEDLMFWKNIADNGFVGYLGNQGIKKLFTKNNDLYELKTLGIKAGERCYALRKENILFVLGLEKNKNKQNLDVANYSKYQVEFSSNEN
jgi:uncharacterized protein